MNKRRTREIGRTKYLMFLPLAALLMIVSNIEAVARATQKIANEMLESTEATTAQPQPKNTSPQPQQGKPEKVTYKGKIVDEAGNALGNVQIITDRKFQSTTVSTVNTKGEFRVETSSSAGVVFKYTTSDGKELGCGYSATELSKMDPNNMVIVLKPIIYSPRSTDDNGNTIYEVVEQMPEFPDGGQSGLMDYLKKNIQYPEAAKKAGVQGRVILQFVVAKDGSIENVSILRGVNPDLDKEAIRVVSNMPNWKPGMQKGKPVSVKYTVPIAFSLPSEEIDKIDEMIVVGYQNTKTPDNAEAYETVEQMPQFPGGMTGLMQYLAKNVKYPADAQKEGIQGKVFVQIIVDENGKVSNAKIVQGISPSLDAEALRVVYNMPQWRPGMKDGKPVSVKYAFPINFRLQ